MNVIRLGGRPIVQVARALIYPHTTLRPVAFLTPIGNETLISGRPVTVLRLVYQLMCDSSATLLARGRAICTCLTSLSKD